MAKALNILSTIPTVTPIERVAISPTSEGGGYLTQRVVNASPMTTSTNHTAPLMPKAKPHAHLWNTRSNTPGAVSPIQVVPVQHIQRCSKHHNQELEEDKIFTLPNAMLPNSYQIPPARSNTISQETLNAITRFFMKSPVHHGHPKCS